MPPTRGHDLKRGQYPYPTLPRRDAPHTGARLETLTENPARYNKLDAPHTGARLETKSSSCSYAPSTDAPHTGARLETSHFLRALLISGGCPPHGGTT